MDGMYNRPGLGHKDGKKPALSFPTLSCEDIMRMHNQIRERHDWMVQHSSAPEDGENYAIECLVGLALNNILQGISTQDC